MRGTRASIVPLVTAAVLIACAPARAQQTVAADRFVDSVGINIHLHYDDTLYYKDFPLIKNRLVELGVRHVRDGLVDQGFPPYYERFAELAQAGIKGTFIVAPNHSTEVWLSFPVRVGGAVEAYEGPNELDKSRDPNWAQTLAETMRRLRTIKEDPRTAAYPVYAPSLTSEAAYTALGDISASFDFANMHNYFAGRHPGTGGWGSNGYGSIEWNLALNRRFAGGKPIVSTETGYHDATADTDGVPQQVAGRYMPRLLLEQFRAGIVRTFIYELLDSGGESYGLLGTDGSPKPAFNAVRGLLNLLSDPGPPFETEDLPYTVEGDAGDLRHMAFQKRDGTYFLALWVAAPGWDPGARRPMAAPSRQVAVRLPEKVRVVRTHRWQPDGSMSSSQTSTPLGATYAVSVGDALTVVEISR
jgi:hypothetical protein